VIQLILHLHECADPAPTKSAPAESAAAADPAPVDSVAAEFTAESLHSVANYAADTAAMGATLIETS
jgi:hypothetical protein